MMRSLTSSPTCICTIFVVRLAHPLCVFQLKLDLSAASLDQMKQKKRGQPLQFIVGGMLAHIENLRHAVSLSFSVCVSFLSLKNCLLHNASKEGAA